MMTINSEVGQALLDAFAGVPEGEVTPESLDAFLAAANEVVNNLHDQGFRPGREGD